MTFRKKGAQAGMRSALCDDPAPRALPRSPHWHPSLLQGLQGAARGIRDRSRAWTASCAACRSAAPACLQPSSPTCPPSACTSPSCVQLRPLRGLLIELRGLAEMCLFHHLLHLPSLIAGMSWRRPRPLTPALLSLLLPARRASCRRAPCDVRRHLPRKNTNLHGVDALAGSLGHLDRLAGGGRGGWVRGEGSGDGDGRRGDFVAAAARQRLRACCSESLPRALLCAADVTLARARDRSPPPSSRPPQNILACEPAGFLPPAGPPLRPTPTPLLGRLARAHSSIDGAPACTIGQRARGEQLRSGQSRCVRTFRGDRHAKHGCWVGWPRRSPSERAASRGRPAALPHSRHARLRLASALEIHAARPCAHVDVQSSVWSVPSLGEGRAKQRRGSLPSLPRPFACRAG
jgi:hypothetical protein